MEAILEYLSSLENRGIRLNEQDGKIKYNAPKGALISEDIEFLKAHKPQIIEILKRKDEHITIKINAAGKYEPFPLTDIQEAYLLGRNNTYHFGGVSCHIYLEIEYPALDADRVELVWNGIIERHGMLRTVFNQNGYQQELMEVPDFNIKQAADQDGYDQIRDELANKMYPVDQWPLFDIGVSQTGQNSILHYSTEFLIVDWTSIWGLLAEFEAVYFRNQKMPKLNLSFRDYVLAEGQLRNTLKYKKDQEYWRQKIPALAAAPKIPRDHSKELRNTFRRMQLEIAPKKWNEIKERCRQAGITPTGFILTMYAKVLARYSESADFCINMIMLNRHPLHEEVNQIVGDFTSNTLIPVSLTKAASLFDEILEINQAIFETLDHGLYSGVEILRELSRQKGRDAAFMPIIFTSAIGISSQNDEMIGKILNTGISQTPQAFVDCQVMDGAFGLRINWDVREGVFYDGYLEDMFQTFEKSLLAAVSPNVNWHDVYQISLPKWQQSERDQANATDKPMIKKTLHQLILEQAEKTPDLLAAADSGQEICYRELVEKSINLAALIKQMGGRKGSHIGIIMPKNVHQIIGALGTLLIGGVFVPIDDSEATMRTEMILKQARVDLLLTHRQTKFKSTNVTTIEVDQLDQIKAEPIEISDDPDVPAYIIHTSGSTGVPKGVVINHQAAVNTIGDINSRFQIGQGDCVLGLSQLNFDLSIYDIFGLLSVGGAVVYPDVKKYADPSHWVSLMQKYHISVWNSVPSLLVMLQEYMEGRTMPALAEMRTVLLSGDWIPLHLPQKAAKFFPNSRIISLGGATEAAIWSIFHEYQGLHPEWVSIPYGKPLANQQIHILNAKLEDSPVWLKGDLYISGEGLAVEYFGDQKRTDEQFLEVSALGKRLYRTGDTGRYMPGGEIEFLGREDKQVKILGYRIELGEIEATLKQYQGVEGAVVLTMPVSKITKIIGVIWGNTVDLDEELMKEFLKTKIPSYMLPYRIFQMQQVPLTANGKIDKKAVETKIKEKIAAMVVKQTPEDPAAGTIYSAQIKNIVCSIMELEDIGVNDDFFALGANSLVMNRIAVSLEEQFSQLCGFEEILIQLLNYPNINDFSKFLERESGGKEIE